MNLLKIGALLFLGFQALKPKKPASANERLTLTDKQKADLQQAIKNPQVIATRQPLKGAENGENINPYPLLIIGEQHDINRDVLLSEG